MDILATTSNSGIETATNVLYESSNNSVEVYPEENITIVKNVYYSSNRTSPTQIAYSGWDCINPVNISDVDYIAVSGMPDQMFPYTYTGDGTILSHSGIIFNLNGTNYHVYRTNGAPYFAPSSTASTMSTVKIRKIKTMDASPITITEVQKES